ncbi:hypothetical protein N7526_008093 [Penicillium atrosanguineum]|nr:hypothetical protein N7526_008093 [Penicillium atrosanguineum]
MSPKRACDACISRKVKCNGSWPCDTCRNAVKRIPCTYLRPVRKRGPKARRVTWGLDSDVPFESSSNGSQGWSSLDDVLDDSKRAREIQESYMPRRISKRILAPIIRLYQEYSYSVWPVVDTDALLGDLDDIEPEKTSNGSKYLACLATALCAATMAQLHLAPVVDGSQILDSSSMAQACLRMRGSCDSQGEDLDISSVLVSFFLHVYHAKVNQRNSAMMYIQEAISRAKILRLDEGSLQESIDSGLGSHLIANKELVFPLLWVSERGWALHLGLSPSCLDRPALPDLEDYRDADIHVQGLLDLVRLFTAFDQISVRRKPSLGITSATELTEIENKLSSLCLSISDQVTTRTADCHITREWMRTIIWQEALSVGLLSSASFADVMTFGFPAQVGHDLLQALRCFSQSDLLPLGRDQLLKCFEVANSLADTVLLTSLSSPPGFELGPQDFLHALYQKLAPFLEQDDVLNSILRTKTAEVLVMTPARLLTRQLGDNGFQGHESGKEKGQLNNSSSSWK